MWDKAGGSISKRMPLILMPQKFHHYITSDFVSTTRKMNYNDCDVILLSLNKLHRGLDAASEVIYRANVNSIIKIEDEF